MGGMGGMGGMGQMGQMGMGGQMGGMGMGGQMGMGQPGMGMGGQMGGMGMGHPGMGGMGMGHQGMGMGQPGMGMGQPGMGMGQPGMGMGGAGMGMGMAGAGMGMGMGMGGGGYNQNMSQYGISGDYDNRDWSNYQRHGTNRLPPGALTKAGKIFRMFDHDGSGKLNRREAAAAINAVYQQNGFGCPHPEDIMYYINEYDRNGDNKLSKKEFKKLLKEIDGESSFSSHSSSSSY